ncbi:MAG: tetratricopeptide repeat protein [Chloroflexota bacterium]
MTIKTTLPPTADASNPYAELFFDYIHRSLEDTLEEVKAIKDAMPDERRLQICHILDYGLGLPSAWESVSSLAVQSAPYMERSGDWDEWEIILRRAVELAHDEADTDSEMAIMILLARLSQRQNHFKQVVYYYRQVIKMARLVENQYEEARACSNLGYLFINTERIQRSETLCLYALVLFKKLNSKHGLAHTHNHLGITYTKQERYTEAEYNLDLACKMWQALQDNHGLFLGHTNLGFLYIEKRQPDKALFYLSKAFHDAQVSGEQMEIAKAWNNKGLFHLLFGNLIEAEALFFKAQEIFVEKKNLIEIAKTQHNLGLMYQYRSKWKQAYSSLQSARKNFELLGRSYEEIKVLVALTEPSSIFNSFSPSDDSLNRLALLIGQHTNGKFEKFYHHYKKSYHDSLLNRGNSQ